jgi:molybdopterin-containing oxidoreductase family membrane subunit
MTEQTLRTPLVLGNKTLNDVTETMALPLETKPSKAWYIFFFTAVLALLWGVTSVVYQIGTGIGTWGLNKTVGWAYDITNFVFWVGIGHAGTLISAILLLFRQKWRNSINRAAEAMTIFAVICAGMFPFIHLGRPWMFFWFFPLPNTRELWVNFNSPLLWDFFAISTYFTVSLVFWYIGMVPDFGTLRDRATSKLRKAIYSLLSLQWKGGAKDWSRHESVSLVLAAVATPLVLSVHSIVSTDFATSVIPGWHTTIFPPYFVAGAIFSGFAMVLTLMIILNKIFPFGDYITKYHFEQMAKVIVLTGTLVGLAYSTEFFIAWYSGNGFEQYAFVNRAIGPYAWAYWTMVTCNVIIPQTLWFKKLRTNITYLFIISIFVNIGMWFERFVIIVISLHRDFLPSSWAMYSPTIIEIGTFVGSFGLFFTLFLIFTRVAPYMAMSEVKDVVVRLNKKAKGGAHHG